MRSLLVGAILLCTSIARADAPKPEPSKPVEPSKPTEAAPDGPIAGTIVQVLAQNDKSVLVLNKGAKSGVKKGQKGRVDGLSGKTFVVTEVFEFRCKASIDVGSGDIKSRAVTIDR